MRTLRTFLGGLLAAFALVAVSPAVAHACSCATATTAQYADGADVVFTGTLTDVVPPPRRPIMSSGDPATLRFRVSSVSKGEARETTEVTTAVSGSSCGIGDLPVDREYVVFAHGSDTLSVGLCDGTARATPALQKQVERALGPPGPPAAGTLAAPRAEGAWLTWLLVGAAGATAAGTAYLIVRRRRSHG